MKFMSLNICTTFKWHGFGPDKMEHLEGTIVVYRFNLLIFSIDIWFNDLEGMKKLARREKWDNDIKGPLP